MVGEGLVVQDLSWKVGEFTLQGSFSVAAGARVALTAPSGAGKTTLLRFLAGLETPPNGSDSGRVFLEGREITNESPQSRQMGFVFQEPALFDSMNVWENAAFGLRMRGVGKEVRRREAMQWLERAGLSHAAERGVGFLSGGERQRVAFVRALIWKPKVLLLDEPFSALDAAMRMHLRTELLRLHEAWPVPLLIATHDREDIEAISNSCLAIREVSQGLRQISVG